jgi:hypothetical protein
MADMDLPAVAIRAGRDWLELGRDLNEFLKRKAAHGGDKLIRGAHRLSPSLGWTSCPVFIEQCIQIVPADDSSPTDPRNR